MGKISDNYDLIGILFQDNFKKFQARDLINLSDKYNFKKSETNDNKIIYEVEEGGGNNFNTILSEVYNNQDISYNVKTIIGNNGVGKSTILDIVENYYSDKILIKDKAYTGIISKDFKFSSGPNKSILYIVKDKDHYSKVSKTPLKLNNSKLLEDKKYENFIIDDKPYEYFKDKLLLGALNITENKKDIKRVMKINILTFLDIPSTEEEELLFILKFYIICVLGNDNSISLDSLSHGFILNLINLYNNFGERYSKNVYNLTTYIRNHKNCPIVDIIKNTCIEFKILENELSNSKYLNLQYEYYYFHIFNNKDTLKLFCKSLLIDKGVFEYISSIMSDFIDKRYLDFDFPNIFELFDDYLKGKEDFKDYNNHNFDDYFEKYDDKNFDHDFDEDFEKFYHKLGESENLENTDIIETIQGEIELLFNSTRFKNLDSLEGKTKYIELDLDKYKEIISNFKKQDSSEGKTKDLNGNIYSFKETLFEGNYSNLLEILFTNNCFVNSGISPDVLIEKNRGDFYISDFSSGEKHLIGILNGIYEYTKNSITKEKNITNSLTILLDEPESSLHIDWQRKFIYNLITGINSILKDKGKVHINLIMATHSPFIISDLFEKDIIFLQRDNTTTSISDFATIQSKTDITLTDTFLGNIPELLRGGFFLEDQIGELGNKYISSITNKINLFNIEIKINQLNILLSQKNLLNIKKKEVEYDIEYLTNKINKTIIFLNRDNSEKNISKLSDDIDKLIKQMKNMAGDQFNLDYLFLKNINND